MKSKVTSNRDTATLKTRSRVLIAKPARTSTISSVRALAMPLAGCYRVRSLGAQRVRLPCLYGWATERKLQTLPLNFTYDACPHKALTGDWMAKAVFTDAAWIIDVILRCQSTSRHIPANCGPLKLLVAMATQ